VRRGPSKRCAFPTTVAIITLTITGWRLEGVYGGQSAAEQRKIPANEGLRRVAGLGFEPRLTDLESASVCSLLFLVAPKYPGNQQYFRRARCPFINTVRSGLVYLVYPGDSLRVPTLIARQIIGTTKVSGLADLEPNTYEAPLTSVPLDPPALGDRLDDG
jgi:hypothetical protein